MYMYNPMHVHNFDNLERSVKLNKNNYNNNKFYRKKKKKNNTKGHCVYSFIFTLIMLIYAVCFDFIV